MLESENNKIYDYLKSKGLDVSEENTLGIDNGIDFFKKGAKFHLTPMFVFPLSKDSITFEEALRIHNINNMYNSKYEDIFVVTKRIKKVSRKNQYAFLEAMNTRTKEKHILAKSDYEIENYSTYYLLLYI